MEPSLTNPAPGLRGYVWSFSGSWFSGYTQWNPRLGMRNLAVDSGKSHDTLEEAYARAASLATTPTEPPC
jgi:hypothetical protein